jgi:hypothetical protein
MMHPSPFSSVDIVAEVAENARKMAGILGVAGLWAA